MFRAKRFTQRQTATLAATRRFNHEGFEIFERLELSATLTTTTKTVEAWAMGETVALRLLLAFFTSVRKAKGAKGARWCEKYVGGMYPVLQRWEGGIAPADNGAALDRITRYCRACGECPAGDAV
jgi:hypothetical protein